MNSPATATSLESVQRGLAGARLVIVAATLITLWPLVRCDFGGFDDAMNLSHNPRLNPPIWRTVLHYWRSPEFDLYVPVTYTVWAAVAKVAYLPTPNAAGVHLNPHLFHLTNLLLHTISALLVFEILRRCVRNVAAAMLGALLFALHPLQIEPVGWAAGMKDVLAGMLALVALWQYVEVVRLQQPPRARWHWLVGSIAFVGAMLSKPGAVVLPAIAWVIDVAFLSRSVRSATARTMPWIILAIPCMIWTRVLQPATDVGNAIPVYLRPLVAIDALTFYLHKLVWPVHLGVDYGRIPQTVIAKGWISSAWIVPVAVVATAWLARRRAPALATALAIFVIALAPVLGLIAFDFQAYSTVADHYMYLAMLGPALAAAWVATRIPGRITPSSIAIIVIALALLARRQTSHWIDPPAIYAQALEVNPRSWAAHAQLASHFGARGDYATALEHAQQAAAINPHAFTLRDQLAMNLVKLGRIPEAIDAYLAALAINPTDVLANINLGNLLADERQFPEAIERYRVALHSDPGSAVAHTNLGGVYEETGRIDEAIAQYRRALSIDPGSPEARAGLARAIRAR